MKMRLVLTLVVSLCVYLSQAAADVKDNGETGTDPGNPPGGDVADPTTKTPKATAALTPPPPVAEACKPPSPNPQFPKIEDWHQFSTYVEAKIERPAEQKKYTVGVEEFYDENGNRGAVYKTKNGKEEVFIYDYENVHSFTIDQDKCTAGNIADSGSNQFSFFSFNYTSSDHKHGHIDSIADLFSFGSDYGTALVDDDTEVRSIPARKWTSCIKNWRKYANIEFDLHWYFSKLDYDLPNSQEKEIPLRAEMWGRDSNNGNELKYHHVYDFIHFKLDLSKADESKFTPPIGKVCEQVATTQQLPVIPDYFSVDVELIQNDAVSDAKYVFDKEASLARHDILASSEAQISEKFLKMYNRRPTSIIHDFTTGHEYAIDVEVGNCSIRAIRDQDSLFTHDWIKDPDHNDNDTDYVLMGTGSQLFSLRPQDLHYQGKRNVRGVECDAWALGNAKDYAEVYFYPKIQGSDKEGVLMGLVKYHGKDPSHDDSVEVKQKFNMFNFNSNKPDVNAFDIQSCYMKDHKWIHGSFQLHGTWNDIVGDSIHLIQNQIRQQLAKAANISPIRINNLLLDKSNDKDDDVTVWFTILDKPPVSGTVFRTKSDKNEDEAMEDLEDAVDNGLTFKLTDKDDKEISVQVKKKTMQTDDEEIKGDPRTTTIIKKGHGSAAMGTLAFFMLLIGAMGGIGVGFWLWKRGRGIPYQVHH